MKMHCVNFCSVEKSSEYPNVQDFMKFDTTIFSFALIGYEIDRRHLPRWLFTISCPTRAHGIMVNYQNMDH